MRRRNALRPEILTISPLSPVFSSDNFMLQIWSKITLYLSYPEYLQVGIFYILRKIIQDAWTFRPGIGSDCIKIKRHNRFCLVSTDTLESLCYFYPTNTFRCNVLEDKYIVINIYSQKIMLDDLVISFLRQTFVTITNLANKMPISDGIICEAHLNSILRNWVAFAANRYRVLC